LRKRHAARDEKQEQQQESHVPSPPGLVTGLRLCLFPRLKLKDRRHQWDHEILN
jgi:hypothetical protein